MGLFSRHQSDEEWLGEVKPAFQAAHPRMSEMNRALDSDSLQEQYAAIQSILDYLPTVEKAVKLIRAPSSRESQEVHKFFRSALKNYIAGAKQGAIFFKDISSGPGQRAFYETGLAQIAATEVGWPSAKAFSDHSQSPAVTIWGECRHSWIDSLCLM